MKEIIIKVEGEDGCEVLNNLKAVYDKIAEQIVLGKMSGGVDTKWWNFGTDKYKGMAKFRDKADK